MEFETYADVIDAYNANDMGYSTLTDYIKGQNIKIKEIEMEPLADLQKSLFENKADGGMIGIEVLFKEKMKDGGRAGFFMGGPALEGPALSIYNSMSAYGFSDQEIANAIKEAGYELPTSPTEETGIIASAPNIINQDRDGGDGPPSGPTFNRNDLLGTTDYFPAEPFSFSNLASDIADYVKSGGIFGAIGKGIKGLFSRNVKDYVTTPQLKARDRVEAERKAKEAAEKAAAERAAFLAEQQRTNIASQLGGPDGQSGGKYEGGAAFASANPYGGSGTMDDLGADSFKEGGLATMFTRRR